MFVSQERGATRKPFQKPNILRRKPKSVGNTQKSNESPENMSLLPVTSDIRLAPTPVQLEPSRGECSQTFQLVQAPHFRVVGVSELCNQSACDTSQTLEINGDSITIYAHNAQPDNNDECGVQSTLNVESFLNNGSITQDNILFNIDGTSSAGETDNNQKWCLDFVSEESKDTVTTNYYDGSQINNIYIDKSSDSIDSAAVPLSIVSLLNHETNTAQEVTNEPAQNLAPYNDTSKALKFKFQCDFPACSKSFWTEARLQTHKKVHSTQKPKTPTILECPVKKLSVDGLEMKCEKTFLIRNQLMKHLNDDHSPEDAIYKCNACGRRFFWASGARAHQTNGCARAIACAWPGCGRVFRQPCRLREHARAHTGARPYPCHYPNCGWAFRSASKLMRHARRHTGERQHACAACGRAFLRREHLREHAARHHAAPAPLHCTHQGCEQTFNNPSALYMHMKKVHKKEGKPAATKRAPKNSKAKKDTYVDYVNNITGETESPTITPIVASVEAQNIAEETVESVSTEAELLDVVEEGRSARTHCTWPLQRTQQDYILEDDAQVEQSEGSESNIYTVRSDLFLHGNVLINEDSEFIISRAAMGVEDTGAIESVESETGEGARGTQLDAALGLIDSHPTIDLMQEELMYADAVDESSFRVFLTGEELEI